MVELNLLRRKRKARNVTFLLQEGAIESREFEIFYVRKAGDLDSAAILSLTETVNLSGAPLVVNSLRNSASIYRIRTPELSEKDKEGLWSMMKRIGFFRPAYTNPSSAP